MLPGKCRFSGVEETARVVRALAGSLPVYGTAASEEPLRVESLLLNINRC